MEVELLYSKWFDINDTQTDCFSRLRPSALLEITQQVASEHAWKLGQGRDVLEPKGLFWAIVRQTVNICRMPRQGERILVETWPGPATRTAFPRHVAAVTERGEPLFQIAALWLFMDQTARTMVLPRTCGLDVPGMERGGELPLPKGLARKGCPVKEHRQVRYSELDCNGHLSNTKYANWMQDVLPAAYHRDHCLRKLHICYMNEALVEQSIDLGWTLEDDVLTMEAGRNTGGENEPVFALRAWYEAAGNG